MSRRNSQEPVALLTPEEREAEREIKAEADIEADGGRIDAPKDQNLDHEYSVPSTVKFAWLGTYFFFSLMLTLYNKMVLGMVSPLSMALLSAFSGPCGSACAAIPATSANASRTL